MDPRVVSQVHFTHEAVDDRLAARGTVARHEGPHGRVALVQHTQHEGSLSRSTRGVMTVTQHEGPRGRVALLQHPKAQTLTISHKA